VERLASALEEDLAMVERFPQLGGKDPTELRGAQGEAGKAASATREVKDELEQLFPDPRGVLPPSAQARLEGQSRRQEELARRASELRQRMEDLSAKAPLFPPQAGESLREAQGQMQGAAGELEQRNPQRGHGRQRQAMDALARFRAGMEQMARRQPGPGGGGMPMPFAMESGGREEGDGLEPSQEDVEIPGAEAYKAPEAFRRGVMDAMKQGTPEPYKGEVSRYYQEIVR
jgi:hypothetical protein